MLSTPGGEARQARPAETRIGYVHVALRSEWGRYDQAEAKPVRRRERGEVGAQSELRCSFCWKPRSAVHHLVGGPGEGPNQVFICDECVALCAEIMVEEEDEG